MLEFDDKDTRLSVQLADTEAAILQAAAQIYSALIVSGKADQGKEKECMKKAIQQAMLMATTIDDGIKAEGEF